MIRRLCACVMVLIGHALIAAPAAAQDETAGTFVSGPIEWTPTFKLADFGYDSNVFLDPRQRAVEDITGSLSSGVAAAISNPRFEMRSSASADLVYFERYVEQRAINQRYAGRLAVNVSLFQPFVAGDWERVRDRQSPEVDLRARRVNRTTTVGLGLFSLNRASLTLSVSKNDLEYDAGQIFESIDIATQLNRSTELATAGFNFALTPLTSMSIGAALQRDTYPLTTGKDQQIQRASVGIQFAPDAVLRGHASVGYSRLTVEDPAAIPYQGLTTDIDMGYSLFEVTRLQARYSRETTASVTEPYYLQSEYSLRIIQAFLGPVELLFRGSRQELDYPGLPARNLQGHLDVVRNYGAGLLFGLSSTSTLDVTYEISDRQSTDPNLRFERRRLITSVSLGF
jgi:opacity protein-like surface antigen